MAPDPEGLEVLGEWCERTGSSYAPVGGQHVQVSYADGSGERFESVWLAIDAFEELCGREPTRRARDAWRGYQSPSNCARADV
jgi:hypothetical protein